MTDEQILKLAHAILAAGASEGQVTDEWLQVARFDASLKHVGGSLDWCREFARLVSDRIGNQSVELCAMRERVAELESALSTALAFIDDATIEEGQWHWLDDVRAIAKGT